MARINLTLTCGLVTFSIVCAVALLAAHEAVRFLWAGLGAERASVAGSAGTLVGYVVTGAVTCHQQMYHMPQATHYRLNARLSIRIDSAWLEME